MKKVILVVLVLAAVAGSAFAADFDILSFPTPVDPGSMMIDAGIGMRYLSWLSLLGVKMSIPPLFVEAEYALPAGVPISVGGAVSFGQWNFWDMAKLMYITPHIRANWHWGFDVPWLDFYTGVSIGYDIVVWSDKLFGSGYADSSGLYYSFQAGAHFYFSRNFGIVLETGYPYWIKAGLALKFGGNSSASRSSRSSGNYMLVDADSLNVRKGPSADTDLVGTLQRNARVQVLEKPGQWWKIKSGSIEGYVNSTYLKSER